MKRGSRAPFGAGAAARILLSKLSRKISASIVVIHR